MKKEPFNLEDSITELEKLIGKMENEQLPLEKSLALFEKGIGLLRECQSALSDAEQQVKILTDDQLKPFTTGDQKK